MRNRVRSIGEHLGRPLIIIIGVLAGMAAVDAVLVFLFLLFSPLFAAVQNPYIGLMVVALPVVALIGGTVAWAAYLVLQENAPVSDVERGHQRA
jgi:hypothetical protein